MSAMTDGIVSRKARTMRTSAVREMMQRMGAADVISFGGGLPDPALFPAAEIAAAAAAVMAGSAGSALQYSTSEGFTPLREYIASELMARAGVNACAEDVIITSGSQQGLDLLARVLIDPGDHILVERPSYLAALQAFDQSQPVYHGVSLQEDGADVAGMREILNKVQAKFFYAIPDFQNPSGICYSEFRRQQVADLLAEHGTLLVEDSPYALLSFDSPPRHSLASYCGKNVVYLGTFSKILAPGMRLGWLVAPDYLRPYLIRARQASDLCPSVFSQQIVWRLLQEFDLDRHLQNLRRCYTEKRDAMLAALKKYMPDSVKWNKPAGGMFVWLQLPQQMDAGAVLEQALQKGVLFVPGESFFRENVLHNTLRLNFTHSSLSEIDRGISLLAEAVSGK